MPRLVLHGTPMIQSIINVSYKWLYCLSQRHSNVDSVNETVWFPALAPARVDPPAGIGKSSSASRPCSLEGRADSDNKTITIYQ